MILHLHPIDLQLRHTFRISHGARTQTRTLLVGLHDSITQQTGWGETVEIPYYDTDRDQFVAQLEGLRPTLASLPFQPPDALPAAIPDWESLHPFVRCGLDEACHDLWGKRMGQSVRALWDLPATATSIPTSYTIGQGPIPEMVERLRERPWPIYKIKLGTDRDLEIIRALRAKTAAVIRVDANAAWTPEETVEKSAQLKELDVEFIEQPLPVGDTEGQRYVFEHSHLPLIADESCQQEADVASCAGQFHGINIKLTKCGGLGPARRMITQARQLGLQVMIGCMTESSVGISAAAQLLPLVDYADLDGALLIANDPAEGVVFDDQGIAQFPERAGTGVLVSTLVL